MTKSNCTFTEQKQNVVEFFKKYKHMLCVDKKNSDLSDKHIKNVVNAKTYEDLFDAVSNVRLKIGTHYYLFCNNPDERHKALQLYMPVCLDNMQSDDKIDDFIKDKTLVDLFNNEYCEFCNITPRRWKIFTKMFSKDGNKFVRIANDTAYFNIDKVVEQYSAACSAMCNNKTHVDNVIDVYNTAESMLRLIIEELNFAKLQGVVTVKPEK